VTGFYGGGNEYVSPTLEWGTYNGTGSYKINVTAVNGAGAPGWDICAIARNDADVSIKYDNTENTFPYTHADSSTGLPEFPIYLMAYNGNNIAQYFVNNQLKNAALGAFLTTEEYLLLKQIIGIYNSICSVGAFDEGFVSFIAYDYTNTLISLGYPVYHARGVCGNIRAQTDDNSAAEWAAMLEMHTNDGWEMDNHSKTLTQFNVQTDAQIRSDIEDSNAAIVANGFPLPVHFTAPGYIYTAAQLLIIKEYFISNCKGNYAHGSPILKDTDVFSWNAYNIDNDFYDIDLIKKYVDYCKMFKIGIVLIHHSVHNDTGATAGIDKLRLETVIDYIQSEGVRIITFNEVYNEIVA
jgi:hypothetical protein